MWLSYNSPALAQTIANRGVQDHIFTVYGVEVDVTARNAREARGKALETAQVQAFWRLLRKISLEDALLDVGKISPLDIRNHVSGIEVHNERTSPRRYMATLDISFNKEKILQFMGLNNLAYSELTGGPLLLLPVYEFAGVFNLFEENNPWRQALYGADIENHLYKFNLAEGGFDDQLLVGNTENLRDTADLSQGRFRTLVERYNASDLLVARVWWGAVADNGLRNLHFSYRRGMSQITEGGVIIAAKIDTQETMFNKAAEAIFTRLDISWRAQTLTTFGSFNQLEVHVVAQTAQEWVDILERLRATPIVRDVIVEKLAVPVSNIKIIYAGVFEQLHLVLAAANLSLREDFDGLYLELAVN